MRELSAIVWTDFENWPTPRRSVWASFVQVASFVEMNFFSMLALLGGNARSACFKRLCRGRQAGSCDHSTSRARPQLPWRCQAPLTCNLPSRRAPSSASGTPARAALASHEYIYPIPTALLPHPCSPRCPQSSAFACSLQRAANRPTPPHTH